MAGLGYTLGKFVGSKPVITLGLIAGVVAGLTYVERKTVEQRTAKEAAAAVARAQAEEARLKEVARAEAALRAECSTNGKAHVTAAAEAKAGHVQAAFHTLKFCTNHLDEFPPVKALYIKVADAARKQDEADAKRAEAVVKAAKKREGVRIGMSQQDVLDSSWGRPDHINRTTGVYGTHEQWVYRNGRGYLYFQNGVLTTVQN